jgi:hypothetical protein
MIALPRWNPSYRTPIDLDFETGRPLVFDGPADNYPNPNGAEMH